MRFARTIIYVLLSIGLIWLIVLLFSRVFSSNSTGKTTTTAPTELVSYANTSTIISSYVDGPVEADNDHESLRISVGRDQVKIEVMRGYANQVIRQDTFVNNTTSYANFLKSLDKAQFDLPLNNEISKDERGSCPLRNRYVYTIDDGSREISRFWTTSCGVGNFRGNRLLIQRLFAEQIPQETMKSVLRETKLSVF